MRNSIESTVRSSKYNTQADTKALVKGTASRGGARKLVKKGHLFTWSFGSHPITSCSVTVSRRCKP